jgi:hypothetical protein
MLPPLLDQENVVHLEIPFPQEDRMMMRLSQLNMYRTIPLISQIMSLIIPISMTIFKIKIKILVLAIFGVDNGKTVM